MNISGGFKNAAGTISNALTVAKDNITKLAVAGVAALGLTGNPTEGHAAPVTFSTKGSPETTLTATTDFGPNQIASTTFGQYATDGITGSVTVGSNGPFSFEEGPFGNFFVINGATGDLASLSLDLAPEAQIDGKSLQNIVLFWEDLTAEALTSIDPLETFKALENGAFDDTSNPGKYVVRFKDAGTPSIAGEIESFSVGKVPTPSTLALAGAGGAGLIAGAAAARTRRDDVSTQQNNFATPAAAV